MKLCELRDVSPFIPSKKFPRSLLHVHTFWEWGKLLAFEEGSTFHIWINVMQNRDHVCGIAMSPINWTHFKKYTALYALKTEPSGITEIFWRVRLSILWVKCPRHLGLGNPKKEYTCQKGSWGLIGPKFIIRVYQPSFTGHLSHTHCISGKSHRQTSQVSCMSVDF